MHPRGTQAAMIMLVAAALASCSSSESPDQAGSSVSSARLSVVASFGPLAELTERVGGSAVNVTNLTKTGVEPHDLEMNTNQVDAIQDAALVVYLGDGFQAAVDDAVRRRRGPSLDVLTVDGVPERQQLLYLGLGCRCSARIGVR